MVRALAKHRHASLASSHRHTSLSVAIATLLRVAALLLAVAALLLLAVAAALLPLLLVRTACLVLASKDGSLGVTGVQADLVAARQVVRLVGVDRVPLTALVAHEGRRAAAMRGEHGRAVGVQVHLALRARHRRYLVVG
eukprot:scaffold85434_cov63-Phaeocystis_antarctica.AAC.2